MNRKQYRFLRSMGYVAIEAYAMANGQSANRMATIAYSGNHVCYAYTERIHWQGWDVFIKV